MLQAHHVTRPIIGHVGSQAIGVATRVVYDMNNSRIPIVVPACLLDGRDRRDLRVGGLINGIG
jgi:hypothetical protein